MCISPVSKKHIERKKVDRGEREKIMLKLDRMHNDMMSVLDTFANDSGNTMISYEQLCEITMGEWLDVGRGVRFMRVNHPDKPVFYITEMNPAEQPDGKAVFGIQDHDCKEICYILKGELMETMEGGKRYSEGDTVIYPPQYLHKPFSTVFSRYAVEFIKPKKDEDNK